MGNQSKLPKDMVIGKCYRVEFCVSKNMVERYVNLTGDYSSLHTDKAFARKSVFRENVVHGMLPVSFISALRLCYDLEYAYFYKILARFIRPVFVDDKLMIDSKVLEIDKEKKQIEIEYSIQNLISGAILTTGYFTLRYGDSLFDKYRIRQSGEDNCNYKMVLDPLIEENLQFEQIAKDYQKEFPFSISESCVRAFYQLLQEGLTADYRFDLSSWAGGCSISNLLTSCLFSTFVGICIPGRHATFIDFNVTFDKVTQLYKKYKFIGRVGFRSESTSTLLEDISIYDLENKKELCGSGKIKVKVNRPPAKMPSVDFLKDNELDLQLKDKVVLITGASRGIGETIAKLFSLYGSKVIVNYSRSKEDAEKIVGEIIKNGGDSLSVQADVSDRQQVKQMIATIRKHYGTIHILVNNAVRDFYPIPFMELTWDNLQKDIDVNVKGAFNCCQEILPLMIGDKKGKIINISTAATDNPPTNQAKYVVSKNALVGLTRSLAVEFAPYNIQVNMVVPSIMETDLTKHISKIFLEGMKNDTPMKRNATPADVAKAVIFLASSLASFTTGQKIMITGGNPPFL